MKLSQATNEQKIKALAELDGCIVKENSFTYDGMKVDYTAYIPADKSGTYAAKPYLTSYDAIIPLVQKHLDDISFSMQNAICDLFPEMNFTLEDHQGLDLDLLELKPQQLADALLIATGKFNL